MPRRRSAVVEDEQRRILQRKHGECLHQSIRYGDFGAASAGFADLFKTAPNDFEKRIGAQVPAHRVA